MQKVMLKVQRYWQLQDLLWALDNDICSRWPVMISFDTMVSHCCSGKLQPAKTWHLRSLELLSLPDLVKIDRVLQHSSRSGVMVRDWNYKADCTPDYMSAAIPMTIQARGVNSVFPVSAKYASQRLDRNKNCRASGHYCRSTLAPRVRSQVVLVSDWIHSCYHLCDN